MKRDDLFPFSFGGNKARKAMLFFEDLEKKECDCVVTYGGSKSNHCRVVANFASVKNVPCYIISPEETTCYAYNSKIIKIFGATIIHCSLGQVKIKIKQKLTGLKEKGHKPYFIPGGGHGNLGTSAYVKVYREIINYEKENNIRVDYIFHASGTGTTQAGLICGQLMHGGNSKIIGISIARRNPQGGRVIIGSVNGYLKSVNRKKLATRDKIKFIDDYVLDGYGTYNNEILNIIKSTLNREGVPLDTTYTGKGFWGMKKYIEKERITGKNILFIHTGGTPSFFDNLEMLVNG